MDACTIISRNYIPFARTMVKSYRKYHPEGRFFVLIIDRPENADMRNEPWETIYADELGMGEELDRLKMMYTAYDMSMSLRPALILHLMRKKGTERVVFLDSDLYFTGKLQEADAWLDKHALSICVSIREPIPDDGCHPSDKDFILAGSLNGGFVLCRKCPETERMMEWLDGKLRKEGFYRPYEGLFGDQKWLDLWVSFCDTLGVIKQKGWNVSHWNIHERPLTKKGGIIYAGDEPMAFYHFSGFRVEQEQVISAHQNRYTREGQPVLSELIDEYRREVIANGYDEWKKVPYLYDLFDNGVRISETVRRAYEETGSFKKFPKPHETKGESFYRWLMYPAQSGSPITNLHLSIWRMSIHARGRFPDPAGKDCGAFAYWILHERRRELALDPVLTQPLKMHALRKRELQMTLDRALALRHVFWPYQVFCRIVKKIIGRNLYYRLKPRTSGILGYPYFRLQITEERPRGVTVVSAKTAENGIGELSRNLVKALENARIPCEHIDSQTAPGRQDIITPLQRLFWYDTIVIAGGADEIGEIIEHTEFIIGPNQRIVGLLPWESSIMPKKYVDGLNSFSEMWAPSRYCADVFRQFLNNEVSVVPCAVDVRGAETIDRTAFGIKKDSFLCLFVFDFFSHAERKNPEAVIAAFQKAFGSDSSAELLIVATHGDNFPMELKKLRRAANVATNVKIHETYLPRPTLLGLMRASDCYMSLHRAEGFGLTIAEAMALAVPTIATNAGGCRDFLTPDTGWPISSVKRILEDDIGPYPKGTEWAEPNVDEAAAALKEIRNNAAVAKVKAAHGSVVIRESFGIAKIGAMVKEILSR